jgi:Holliday junction resolvase
MINSCVKGKTGEREIARILREELGVSVHRNWMMQAAEGGCDLVGINGWAIEVKRAKSYKNDWMKQARRQAKEAGSKPVLLYRLDRHQWTAEVNAHDVIEDLEHECFTVTMPLLAWVAIIREEMQ